MGPCAAAVLLQVLPGLGQDPPEAQLNLVIHYLQKGELGEAYALIKELEPSTPHEYILRVGVGL
jgi:intraflagellar transport protein 56